MTTPKRVLLIGSTLRRSLLREMLAAADDIEIVGEVHDISGAGPELSAVAKRTHPDFVIVAAREAPPSDLYLNLLQGGPLMRVLAVAGDSREAFLWALSPTRMPLGQISRRTLLDAIRLPNWRSVGAS